MIEYITQAIQKIINIIKTLDESMPSPTPLPTLPKCLSFSTLLFPSPTIDVSSYEGFLVDKPLFNKKKHYLVTWRCNYYIFLNLPKITSASFKVSILPRNSQNISCHDSFYFG